MKENNWLNRKDLVKAGSLRVGQVFTAIDGEKYRKNGNMKDDPERPVTVTRLKDGKSDYFCTFAMVQI
jgi:hypothetical protein